MAERGTLLPQGPAADRPDPGIARGPDRCPALRGLPAAHRRFYGPPDDDQVCFATAGWDIDDFEKLRELARELVVERRADAVLAESDFSAPGLVRGWNELGYRVGHDVTLIGWGKEMVGRGMSPALTTIDFNFPEIVDKALDLLGDLIEKPEEKRPHSILVKPKLIVRESA